MVCDYLDVLRIKQVDALSMCTHLATGNSATNNVRINEVVVKSEERWSVVNDGHQIMH